MMRAPLTDQQTVERAQWLLQSGRGAALPELLTLIKTLSSSDATIPEIAEIIEKDAAILTKVISLANTVAHNPGMAPVRTLSQALHQIGYQRVRSMAVSLLLLDKASGPGTTPEQREAAARSLCAGLLAQGLAESLGTHDSELAFACAALRQFGRILMAAISPDHYRAAMQLSQTEPPEENCFTRFFGLAPLQLSERVLSAAHVPPEVLASLRDCEPESLHGSETQHDVRLLGLADFAGRLAAISLDPQTSSERFVSETRGLASRYETLVPNSPEHIKPAYRCADERLRSFLRCKGVGSLPTVSLRRVRQCLETVDPEAFREGDGSIAAIFARGKAPAPAAIGPIEDDMPAADAHAPLRLPPTPPPPAPVRAWALPPPPPAASPPPFSTFEEPPPDDSRRAALALIRDGFAAEECWLFHRPPGATGFSGLCGIGSWWRVVQPRAAVASTERTVFGVCLFRRETVVIHDASEPTTIPYLPEWLRETAGPRGSFVLVPLTAGNTLLGLAYIGWHTPRQITLSEPQLALARQVLASALSPAPAAAPVG